MHAKASEFTNNLIFSLFKLAMADVIMPEQIIKDTYGEIPDELIDFEKLLEEAGLSGAGKAPHRESKSAAAKRT